MRRLSKFLSILFIIFCISCGGTNQENDTSPIIETTIGEQAEASIKEPENNIWVSAKKGDIESIKPHIAFVSVLNSTGSRIEETALIITAYQVHVDIA